MTEDRYQEALEMWFAGKHERAISLFLSEPEPAYLVAATIDIEDKQGREWVLYFGDWLMNYDNPSAIQNYPSDL